MAVDHIRARMREGIRAALANLDTTRDRLFIARVRRFAKNECPALNLHGPDEALDGATIHGGDADREMEFSLEIAQNRVDDYVEELDQVIKECELAIAPGVTVDGEAFEVWPALIKTDYSGEGDQAIVLTKITLAVRAFAALGT